MRPASASASPADRPASGVCDPNTTQEGELTSQPPAQPDSQQEHDTADYPENVNGNASEKAFQNGGDFATKTPQVLAKVQSSENLNGNGSRGTPASGGDSVTKLSKAASVQDPETVNGNGTTETLQSDRDLISDTPAVSSNVKDSEDANSNVSMETSQTEGELGTKTPPALPDVQDFEEDAKEISTQHDTITKEHQHSSSSEFQAKGNCHVKHETDDPFTGSENGDRDNRKIKPRSMDDNVLDAEPLEDDSHSPNVSVLRDSSQDTTFTESENFQSTGSSRSDGINTRQRNRSVLLDGTHRQENSSDSLPSVHSSVSVESSLQEREESSAVENLTEDTRTASEGNSSTTDTSVHAGRLAQRTLSGEERARQQPSKIAESKSTLQEDYHIDKTTYTQFVQFVSSGTDTGQRQTLQQGFTRRNSKEDVSEINLPFSEGTLPDRYKNGVAKEVDQRQYSADQDGLEKEKDKGLNSLSPPEGGNAKHLSSHGRLFHGTAGYENLDAQSGRTHARQTFTDANPDTLGDLNHQREAAALGNRDTIGDLNYIRQTSANGIPGKKYRRQHSADDTPKQKVSGKTLSRRQSADERVRRQMFADDYPQRKMSGDKRLSRQYSADDRFQRKNPFNDDPQRKFSGDKTVTSSSQQPSDENFLSQISSDDTWQEQNSTNDKPQRKLSREKPFSRQLSADEIFRRQLSLDEPFRRQTSMTGDSSGRVDPTLSYTSSTGEGQGQGEGDYDSVTGSLRSEGGFGYTGLSFESGSGNFEQTSGAGGPTHVIGKTVVFAGEVDIKHIYLCQSYEQIIDQTFQDIGWEKNVFVETQSYQTAVRKLCASGILIITGPPGSGKSALSRALLRYFGRQDYKPLILHRFEEWRSHVGGKGTKQIVLLEHVFGDNEVDRASLGKWGRVMNAVKTYGSTGQCFTIMTVAVHIMEQIVAEENLFRNLPLLDLGMAESFAENEKKKMIKRHVREKGGGLISEEELREILSLDKSGPVFPWCCARFADLTADVRRGAAEIFARPALAYVAFIKDYVHTKTSSKAQARKKKSRTKALEKLQQTMQKLRELEDNCGEGPLRQAPISLLKELTDSKLGEFVYYNSATFPCRVMYEAVGVTVGRVFSISYLLNTCDCRFLVDYVHTEDVTSHWSITVKRGSRSWETFLDRIIHDLENGHVQELCQHPSLQSLQFLSDLEEYCIRSGISVKTIATSVDSVHRLPLAYWSMWSSSPDLTQWCLSHLMEPGSDGTETPKGLVEMLFAATLFKKSPQLERAIRNLTMKIPAVVTLFRKERNHCHGIKLPLIDPEKRITLEAKSKCEQYAASEFVYLNDPAYPVPASLLSFQMLGDVVWLVSYCKNLYLTHRLLADKEINERDDTGKTLLEHAVQVGDSYLASYLTGYGAEYYSLERPGVSRDDGGSDFTNSIENVGSFGVKELDQTNSDLLGHFESGPKDQNFSGAGIEADDEPHHADVRTNYFDIGYRRENDFRNFDREKRKTENDHSDSNNRSGNGQRTSESASAQADLGKDPKTKDHMLAPNNGPSLKDGSQTGRKDNGSSLPNDGSHADTKQNWTNFYTACRKGQTCFVKQMLDRSPVIVKSMMDGLTPLHVASAHGRLPIVQILLRRGADVNALTSIQQTPLHLASEKGYVDVVSVLLANGANVNAQDKREWTALHLASCRGHSRVVECLLEHDAKVDAKKDFDCTSLHVASFFGHSDSTLMLLQHGANVDAVMRSGATPLYLASRHGHLTTLNVLLQKHAVPDFQRQTSEGGPLYAASQYGHVVTVFALLQHGAAVNIQQREGFTPLHAASSNGHVDVVEILLRYGADVGLKSHNGSTALRLAKANRHTDVVAVLKRKQSTICTVS